MFSGAWRSWPRLDGANAALHLINDEGGVGGRRVEWVKGDGSTPEQAARQKENLRWLHALASLA
jgi:ABC-type branched-subunit amino acid transport system substrate-binding protein